ncbi:unnamed protein product [Nippostrongylus brasiliensis]|uniref:Microspherule protein 1 (inferred by orthology to a human protein) n=1 Tax=Nippostrongylus brasiliensis TaxID=27835 RepID=A0A0N4YF36_NIPBR|nr:unnamed protein product [Nippostrongylus brasiliensis]
MQMFDDFSETVENDSLSEREATIVKRRKVGDAKVMTRGVMKQKRVKNSTAKLAVEQIEKYNKKKKTYETRHLTDYVPPEWTPEDDFKLILSANHTRDIYDVYEGVTFSKVFTYEDVLYRYHELMDDKEMYRKTYEIVSAQIPWDMRLRIAVEVPFSYEEQRVIVDALLDRKKNATFPFMRELLNKHPNVFHPSRTAGKLMEFYDTYMRSPQMHSSVWYRDFEDEIYNVETEDSEDDIFLEELRKFSNFSLNENLMAGDQSQSIEAESVGAEASTSCDEGSSTKRIRRMLCGVAGNYLLPSRYLLCMGKSTPNYTVDIDISREGHASRMYSEQALIHYDDLSGRPLITNIAPNILSVDQKMLGMRGTAPLYDYSVIQTTYFRLVYREM